ncbi:MAG: hypothetical protein JO258_05925 [Alphaproteobacteria bacterium]|nr:hypothetical protein [Alphaproteobacteria bacterium]
MRRRLWLAALILYAAAGIADGALRLGTPSAAVTQPGPAASLAVAFCAALFWPLDLAARLALG